MSVRVAGRRTTGIGCARCVQSVDAWEWAVECSVELDRGDTTAVEGGILRIVRTAWERLVDCDHVRIGAVSDAEVREFLTVFDNDVVGRPDGTLAPRTCVVEDPDRLTENTKRRLAATFGDRLTLNHEEPGSNGAAR